MVAYVDPPFELGETLSGTNSDGNLINNDKLGLIYTFPASRQPQFAAGNKSRRTGRPITAVALRNVLGAALLPKRIARLRRSAGYPLLEEVDGYCDTLLEKECVIVDEHVDSAGVADDDIFWGILCGPVTILTPTVGVDFNGDIAVGAQLVAATGATTGTTDAGRVSNVTLPAQTGATEAFKAAANLIGQALSARTTGETNSDLLINAAIRY